MITPEDIIAALKQKNQTLAIAESCTGGLIAAAITSVPGSSAVFDRGFVTYSNEAKVEMLGVCEDTLNEHGAVSAEVAEAMVIGAEDNSAATVTLSITGIAGPDGGSAEKPVGLVYIGLVQDDEDVQSYKHLFEGDRESIRIQAVQAALNHLMEALKN